MTSSILLLLLLLLLVVVFLLKSSSSSPVVDAQWVACQNIINGYDSFYCEARGVCLPSTNEGFCACAPTSATCAQQIDPRGVTCRWNNTYNVPHRTMTAGPQACAAGQFCTTGFEFIYRCVPGLNESQMAENAARGIPNDLGVASNEPGQPCKPFDPKMPTLVPQPYLLLGLSIFKDLLVLVVVGLCGNWLAKVTYNVTQTLRDLWNFSWSSHGDTTTNDDLIFYIHDVPFSTKPIRNPSAKKNKRVWSFDDYCNAVAKQLFEKRSTKAAQRDLCNAIAFILFNDFLYVELTDERPISGRLHIPPFVPWTQLITVVGEVLRTNATRHVRYGLSSSALVRIDVALNTFPTPPQLLLYVLSAGGLIALTLGSHVVVQASQLCSRSICADSQSLFEFFYYLVGYRICNSSLVATASLVWLKTVRAFFFTNENDMIANRLSLLILKSSRPVFLLLMLYILLTAPFLLGGIGGGIFLGWPGPVLVIAVIPLLVVLYFIRKCFFNYTATIEMRNLQKFQRRKEYNRIVSEQQQQKLQNRNDPDGGDIGNGSVTTFVDNSSETVINSTTIDNEQQQQQQQQQKKEKVEPEKSSSKNNNKKTSKQKSAIGRRVTNDSISEELISSPTSPSNQDDGNDDDANSSSSTSESSSSSSSSSDSDDDDDDEEDEGQIAAMSKDRPETRSALDFARKEQLMFEEAQKRNAEQKKHETTLGSESKKSFSKSSEGGSDSAFFGDQEAMNRIMVSQSGVSSSKSSFFESCSIANVRFFIRALIRFLLTEEILVVIFSFVFQASFSYTALLAKKEQFGIEEAWQVFGVDYESRKMDCVIAIMTSTANEYSNDVVGKIQHISFALPFV